MTVEQIVIERKKVVAEKWQNLIFATYPAYSSDFLKNQQNQFMNPVGNRVKASAETLLDALFSEFSEDTLLPALNEFVKVRAVQEFTPSQAIGFVFLLKKVLREEFLEEVLQKELLNEWFTLESRIDKLALHTFDLYTRYRDSISDIRVNMEKRRVATLLDRNHYGIGKPVEKNDDNKNGK
ncbi:RsbRD N-terminal domain-containing protein [bacterium]|nr:RsbRD N-terminal domain-containing protein [bacterium]